MSEELVEVITTDEETVEAEEDAQPKPIVTVLAYLLEDGTHSIDVKTSHEHTPRALVWGLVKAIEIEVLERTSPYQSGMLVELLDKMGNLENLIAALLNIKGKE